MTLEQGVKFADEMFKERYNLSVGVLGAGPNLEYLSFINSSVYDKSRFQNRSMTSQVERARASGSG